MATDPMFTATDADRQHCAERLWELRKLIQMNADKLKAKRAKLEADKGPPPEWLQSRLLGSFRCKPGEAIMHSELMADVRQEGEQLEAESE